jgi:hypothetical protein
MHEKSYEKKLGFYFVTSFGICASKYFLVEVLDLPCNVL